ncbi:hypothetical protein CHLRE_17g736900v5 [Chlamydomonas reinhardtii]|uniref:Uncharacterized protein n=1 Tax=Chlamydomonas reinhardtii TaxID=3055 RepID=A0A2K3CRG3_CHLRE|nr:uncharacterized protein CHLRE_17g736900v5 [Chlamydomonas reinhardtii]PNW70869.1 hypothetical protein CHLRE_17g736900v5 [Chlamydomonas reinhardtii]
MLVPGAGAGRGGSDYSKLRGIIRTQKDQVQALENEVAHFQTRLHRIEDGHRLELARLKKEVEYHKRLRQGADQRSYELEDRLARVQREAAAAHHTSHDEEKDSLIVQSQLLVSKNSELTYKLKTMEAQVSQLEELKAALESELNQAYCERDELAAELEHILSRQHQQHSRDPDADGEDGFDDGAEAAAASGPEGGAGAPGSSEEQ